MKRKYIVMFLMIWAVQMAAAFYFCAQKQGFHEDEYYTYYSTARTNGFYVEDGQWMDRDSYRNEFVVLPGQGFQYGLVKLVQSWDVHPPMYYWVFHTAASLVPGVFSKWIGLYINLVFWGINIVLLAYLAYEACGGSEKMALLVTFAYGLSPAAMSGVVFIRMYEMLTMFVLLCAVLHVQALRHLQISVSVKWREKLPVFQCLLPMAVVTYLGFLTQYYYFIFLFYLAAAFCAWLLWHDRKIWNCLRYGVSQGIAFILAYLTYPSCLGQMFRGQRGAQATENFFDLSNTLQRFRFFYELLDEYVFGKMLPVLLLLLVVLFVTAYRKRSMKIEPTQQPCALAALSVHAPCGLPACEHPVLAPTFHDAFVSRATGGTSMKRKSMATAILLFAVLGYFLTVSKTALLLGDTSNRYQMPVYGMTVLLLFQAIHVLWQRVRPAAVSNFRGQIYLWAAAAGICLLVDVAGLVSGRVVFLYPEDKEQIGFAEERAKEGTPVIYLYEAGAEWCVWDVTDELLVYPEIYFASADGTGRLEDDKIRGADSLVAYMAEGVDKEAQAERILNSNPGLSGWQDVFEEKYCSVYYFQ